VRHRLSNRGTFRNHEVADCSECGPRVRIVRQGFTLGGNERWECERGLKDKRAAKLAAKRAKVYAPKKNGKPRKAPGKATGKSLTRKAERLARKACIAECGHKCMAAGRFGVECRPRIVNGRVWPLLEWCHLQSRGMGGGDRLKFHPSNCIAMCGAHHIFFTAHDLTFREFIEEIWPGRWAQLAELERILPKGSGNDSKFWAAYYTEQGFTLGQDEIREAA